MFNEYNQKIIDVSAGGDTVVLQYLLNTSPSLHVKIDALWMAALSGKEGCVRLLVETLKPVLESDTDFSYQALLYAADGGNAACVELLLPFSIAARNTMALKQSAKHGHTACVKTLISVSDPQFNCSEALRHAAKRGHNDCVDVLYAVSNPFDALEQLKRKHPDKERHWWYLAQLCQKEMILNAVHTIEPCNNGLRKI